jgi:hypothetical protein
MDGVNLKLVNKDVSPERTPQGVMTALHKSNRSGYFFLIGKYNRQRFRVSTLWIIKPFDLGDKEF